MKIRSIKRKLVKARIALNQTVQKILDINRKRKNLTFLENANIQRQHLETELRVLNKIAEQQVGMIKKYESVLESNKRVPGDNENQSLRAAV